MSGNLGRSVSRSAGSRSRKSSSRFDAKGLAVPLSRPIIARCVPMCSRAHARPLFAGGQLCA
eukprot:3793486-Alexandrium_andersonii.AAC.1